MQNIRGFGTNFSVSLKNIGVFNAYFPDVNNTVRMFSTPIGAETLIQLGAGNDVYVYKMQWYSKYIHYYCIDSCLYKTLIIYYEQCFH